MNETTGPVVVNSPQNGGAGAKIAIAIIIIVLLVGAYYYFANRTDGGMRQNNSELSDDPEALNRELDSAATVDVEGDLRAVDQEFGQ